MSVSEETYSKDALGYYRIIGVTPDADSHQVKIKYRERAKIWHPDHNSSDEAKENFQKLSVAYDIISNDDKRITYDLLCSAYPIKKMPPLFSLKAYRNQAGQDDFGLRSIKQTRITGKIIKTDVEKEEIFCNYREAVKLVGKVSLHNWLLGWWSLKGIPLTLQALITNFGVQGKNTQEDYRLWVHNALAYWQNKQIANAGVSAFMAGQYANTEQKQLLKKLITRLGNRPSVAIPHWNWLMLKLVQLIFPLVLAVGLSFPLSVKIVSESDLLSYFSQKEQIEYNQEVRFKSGGSMSDDMVVGKIIKIPVDKTDMSKLYHVKTAQNIMYGPSEDFDVLKKLPAGTTVRITGITPDETWYRVMLDEGEMGFVKKENLVPGMGNDIPYGSQIFEK